MLKEYFLIAGMIQHEFWLVATLPTAENRAADVTTMPSREESVRLKAQGLNPLWHLFGRKTNVDLIAPTEATKIAPGATPPEWHTTSSC